MNYGTQSIDQFLAEVASENVIPAGGTVTAIVGASGASLCEMVCIHTLESDEDAGGAELATIRDDLRQLRGRLLDLADADAEAVAELLAVLHEDTTETEAKRATGVPLAIAEGCLAVVDHATVVTNEGTPNAVPDAVTGAVLARSAVDASLFTVRSNLARMGDPSFVEKVNRRAAEIERSAERACEQVLEHGKHCP